MKLLPCAVLALSCIGVAASSPALSGENAMPDQMGMRVGALPGPHGRDHELALSEAQEQKAFALRHALAPLRFEQTAALRKASDALREMADSGQFDEAKAAAWSQAIGKASAALALGQARADAQFVALLTPEQRARHLGDGPRGPNRPRQ
ncbi:periplasmic heavy metal sensor [Massilia sp. B-10]|nr:periplasmic heavy metal sensor [Massilia sp. B-10]UUZ53820.1 periplasmic heavy metal sensor [Massilia sp. H-1]